MENFGAITYRETDFLIDEKTASLSDKKEVASVVAHEMAHQWFGRHGDHAVVGQHLAERGICDLDVVEADHEVAPGVALPPRTMHPSLDATLNLDSSVDDACDSCDGEHAIRDQRDVRRHQLRQGWSGAGDGGELPGARRPSGRVCITYLEAHLYANATAEDFWNAQTATSHKPVDKIMESFVAQPGVPLITFMGDGKAKVDAVESRFYLSPGLKAGDKKAESWTIPVCFKGEAKDCELLSGRTVR